MLLYGLVEDSREVFTQDYMNTLYVMLINAGANNPEALYKRILGGALFSFQVRNPIEFLEKLNDTENVFIFRLSIEKLGTGTSSRMEA